ncbi:MAG TPA: hypothetical protein VHG89_00845 [Verrucomicrobiae bacterium]|nr:hypothetical protein [Verrucomicrobiae bacterium]
MQNETEVDKYKWLTPDFYSKAYDKFVRLYWKHDPFPNETPNLHLHPDDYRFSSREQEKTPGFFFGQGLFELSTMHLVGQINEFYSDIIKLMVWEKILAEYENESQKLHLIVEFIEPLVTSCLTVPYALKNQIIFAGTQIAILLEKNVAMKIPENHEIKFSAFKKWAGTWPEFTTVEIALTKLSEKEFNSYFRHRFTHQMPPRIEIGLTANYRFSREGKFLKIQGGNEPPLPLSKAIELSLEQHKICIETFKAFWTMLKTKLAENKKSEA